MPKATQPSPGTSMRALKRTVLAKIRPAISKNRIQKMSMTMPCAERKA